MTSQISLCWECGKETNKTLKMVPYCDECYNYARLQAKALEQQRQDVRVRTMYEKVLAALFRGGFPMHDHKRHVQSVLFSALKHPSMFASAPEMITAIVLSSHDIPVKCQTKIRDFTVDFCDSRDELIIEVDGERHDWEADRMRDEYLYKCLPDGWVIIRIKAEFTMRAPDKIYAEINREFKKKRGHSLGGEH